MSPRLMVPAEAEVAVGRLPKILQNLRQSERTIKTLDRKEEGEEKRENGEEAKFGELQRKRRFQHAQ